jgi:putative membrane protein
MMLWGWGGDGHLGAAGWAMMVIWAIFWIAVIVAVFFVVRHVVTRSDESGLEEQGKQAPPHHMWRRSEALNILEERYAKGEIDREEFLRKKADLG